MHLEELERKIRENNVAIFGTGFVAEQLYSALIQKKLINHLNFFITTGGGDYFHGYEVLSINDDRIKGVLILVAVHEVLKDEIIRNLESKGCSNYIWIRDEIYPFLLGETVKKGVSVPLKQIWLANRNNYCIAIRYLAIENYYKQNTYGFEIYKWALSLFMKPQTAKKRLEQFIEVIKNWEQNGYNKEKHALILDNYCIFDGTHRISVACYYNQENITCDIFSYKNSLNYPEYFDRDRILSYPKQYVKEMAKDERIITILEETDKKLDEQYSVVKRK